MKANLSSSARKTQTSWATKKISLNQTQNQSFVADKRTTSSCSYRDVSHAEQELGRTYDGFVSAYVEETIKGINRKYKEDVVGRSRPTSSFFTIVSPFTATNTPRSVRQMKICGLAQPASKSKKMLRQPYFLNAKQRLSRMSQRKRQMMQNFETLQSRFDSISEQKRIKRRENEKSFKNPETIGCLEWHNEWEKGNRKQLNRYKVRLSSKHMKVTLQT